VAALHLTDLVLLVEPHHPVALTVAADAHEVLLARSENFWERAWLRRALAKIEKGRST
jgi:hypothetical protein